MIKLQCCIHIFYLSCIHYHVDRVIHKVELDNFMLEINHITLQTVLVGPFTNVHKVHHHDTRRAKNFNFFPPRVSKKFFCPIQFSAQNQVESKNKVITSAGRSLS